MTEKCQLGTDYESLKFEICEIS